MVCVQHVYLSLVISKFISEFIFLFFPCIFLIVSLCLYKVSLCMYISGHGICIPYFFCLTRSFPVCICNIYLSLAVSICMAFFSRMSLAQSLVLPVSLSMLLTIPLYASHNTSLSFLQLLPLLSFKLCLSFYLITSVFLSNQLFLPAGLYFSYISVLPQNIL